MADTTAVLVVEDEAILLLEIVEQLEGEGLEVYHAGNADKAIELLHAHPEIRLVFTDVDMPGSIDGLQLAAEVRKRWASIKLSLLRVTEQSLGPTCRGEADFSASVTSIILF